MARIPWLEDPYHKCQTHCATWLLCSVYACHAWSFHVISRRGTHLTLALRNFVSASSVAVGLRRGCCGDASQEPVWVLYSMGFILFRKVVWAGISQIMMKSSSPSLVVIPLPIPHYRRFHQLNPVLLSLFVAAFHAFPAWQSVPHPPLNFVLLESWPYFAHELMEM